jgi:hypothetical protein
MRRGETNENGRRRCGYATGDALVSRPRSRPAGAAFDLHCGLLIHPREQEVSR